MGVDPGHERVRNVKRAGTHRCGQGVDHDGACHIRNGTIMLWECGNKCLGYPLLLSCVVYSYSLLTRAVDYTLQEAAELGLVTRCVDDPLKEAQVLAEQIVQRSPDSVAMTKQLYQQTWVAPEEYCLRLETELQRKLLVSWNQLAASGRNFGWKLPYFQRRKEDNDK